MTLRTTPKRYHSRDAQLFPALHAARLRQTTPHYYYVRVGPARVTITVDAFFVEEEIRQRLEQLYHDYVRWWAQESRAKRQRFPRGGVWLTRFHDWTSVQVLRDHAEWWIELFNQAAPLTYNPWSLEREQWQAEKAGQMQ